MKLSNKRAWRCKEINCEKLIYDYIILDGKSLTNSGSYAVTNRKIYYCNEYYDKVCHVNFCKKWRR